MALFGTDELFESFSEEPTRKELDIPAREVEAGTKENAEKTNGDSGEKSPSNGVTPKESRLLPTWQSINLMVEFYSLMFLKKSDLEPFLQISARFCESCQEVSLVNTDDSKLGEIKTKKEAIRIGESATAEGWPVPKFIQFLRDPVSHASEFRPRAGFRAKRGCFNCGGDHLITQCKEEWNLERIQESKNSFYQNRMQTPDTKSRYHEGSSFQAGKISDSLREALGIDDDKIPPYIYRMRTLGYPAGWMKEMQERGLSFIGDANAQEQRPIDPNKIMEFPGFNVPPPKDYVDESEEYSAPPQRADQSKEAMVQQLLRSSSTPRPGTSRKATKADPMDTSNPPEDFDALELDSLEREKELLLQALEEDGGGSLTSSDGSKVSEEASAVQIQQVEDMEEAKPSVINAEPVPPVSSPPSHSTPTVIRSQSLSMELGTPIVVRHSPFEKLPSRESFAQNIGEHSITENLSSSSGRLMQIRQLFDKRKQL